MDDKDELIESLTGDMEDDTSLEDLLGADDLGGELEDDDFAFSADPPGLEGEDDDVSLMDIPGKIDGTEDAVAGVGDTSDEEDIAAILEGAESEDGDLADLESLGDDDDVLSAFAEEDLAEPEIAGEGADTEELLPDPEPEPLEDMDLEPVLADDDDSDPFDEPTGFSLDDDAEEVPVEDALEDEPLGQAVGGGLPQGEPIYDDALEAFNAALGGGVDEMEAMKIAIDAAKLRAIQDGASEEDASSAAQLASDTFCQDIATLTPLAEAFENAMAAPARKLQMMEEG